MFYQSFRCPKTKIYVTCEGDSHSSDVDDSVTRTSSGIT